MKTQWQQGDRIECDMMFVTQAAADAPEGYIAGIASTPSTDLYGHKVLAKAFDDSIKQKGLTGPRGIKLLASHDWHKPAGVIKRLETIGDNLKIEAQLNLNVSYVKDMHEVAKQNGGLSFSVGFALDEFEFVDDDEIKNEDDPWLIIKKGDLMEVSVVVFPAQLEAEMTFIKVAPPNTLTELEKALVADGTCRSRSEVKRLIRAIKPHAHLLTGKPASEARAAGEPEHLNLDASILKPMADLLAKAKATLSSR
jgi:HK97 family phage prohead protease